MGTNAFYQFDSGKQNMYGTLEYSGKTELLVGVGSGQADSRLHNKLFYQMSTITSALAQVFVNCGYDMGPTVESNWSSVVSVLSKISVFISAATNYVTMAMNGVNYEIYTKSGVENYVTGLLANYPTIADMNKAISDAIGSGVSSSITIAEVKQAIGIAFSDTAGTIKGISFTPYKANYTEVQIGTDNIKYITPQALKQSKFVPHLNPSVDGYLIMSEGGEWVTKSPGMIVNPIALSAAQSAVNSDISSRIAWNARTELNNVERTSLSTSVTLGSGHWVVFAFASYYSDVIYAVNLTINGTIVDGVIQRGDMPGVNRNTLIGTLTTAVAGNQTVTATISGQHMYEVSISILALKCSPT